MSTIPKTGRTVVIWNDAECMGEMNTFRMEDMVERAAITHPLRILQPDGTSMPGYINAKCHVARNPTSIELTYRRTENPPRVPCGIARLRYELRVSDGYPTITVEWKEPNGNAFTPTEAVAIWLSNRS
jgi:hypothetical protein